MKALNLTNPSVTASSLLILNTNSLRDFVIGPKSGNINIINMIKSQLHTMIQVRFLPCLAVASTICQTELFTAPKEVSIFSFSPSLKIAYKAGHSAFSAILAQAGDSFESPKKANSA